eukprot:2196882-Ditylum_brightwellii.AAC.1
MIEYRQQRLDKTEKDNMEVKARMETFQAKDGAETKTSAIWDLCKTLQIPNYLFSFFSSEQKQAFLKWKNCNVNGKNISNEEISKILKNEDSGSTSSNRQKRKKSKKSGATKIQHTGTQPSSTPWRDVSIGFRFRPVDGKKKARSNKVIRASKSGPTTMGETCFDHNIILDSVTKWTVLGGPAWSI